MIVATVLATKGHHVVTVRPEHTVRRALALLATHNIGALVVEEAGRPVGIISERDIVRTLAETEAIFDWPVDRIMTREVIVGTPGDDLDAVAHTMTERRIRHLPVLDGGRLVGIISIGDVLKAQRDALLGERDTLQFQLLQGQG